MLNETLKHFKDFPKNFFDWILEFSSLPPHYTLQESIDIYKENSHKDLGFIYKSFYPTSASMDNAWYDEVFIPKVQLEVCSIGKPNIFFGSIKEYKELLNSMMNGTKHSNRMHFNFQINDLYHFGKIYVFESNSIKNPMDIF